MAAALFFTQDVVAAMTMPRNTIPINKIFFLEFIQMIYVNKNK